MGRAASKVLESLRALVLKMALAPVRLYQRFVSPLSGRRCKYEPTCSQYAISAFRAHGLVKGTVLAGWRLARCNPFSHGGYDPIESQRIFESHTHEPASPRRGAGVEA
jgi:putative membrane protein insertion efficiency factor